MKLYRKTLDSAVFSDDWTFRLWCWCLMRANYKPRWSGAKEVPPGSFTAGRLTASQELGVSPSKWYRGMQRLEELGQVTLEANSKWTTVTICKWATYQNQSIVERTASEQPADSERTASEQPADTSKEGQESKEGKKLGGKPPKTPGERNRKGPGFDQATIELPEGLCTETFADAWSRWLDHRNAIKKPYRSAESVKAELKALAKLGVEVAVRNIEFSLRSGYQGIYPDKSQADKPARKSRVPTDEELANWNPVDGGLGADFNG